MVVSHCLFLYGRTSSLKTANLKIVFFLLSRIITPQQMSQKSKIGEIHSYPTKSLKYKSLMAAPDPLHTTGATSNFKSWIRP